MYTYHQDPGHGWLEVPRVELRVLGIEDQISSFSYQSHDGSTCYLEEDCDAERFVIAKQWSVEHFSRLTTSKHYDNECFVRALPHFQPRIIRVTEVSLADLIRAHGGTVVQADGCSHE